MRSAVVFDSFSGISSIDLVGLIVFLNLILAGGELGALDIAGRSEIEFDLFDCIMLSSSNEIPCFLSIGGCRSGLLLTVRNDRKFVDLFFLGLFSVRCGVSI